MPVPVATKSEGASANFVRVKNPCGPTAFSKLPFGSADYDAWAVVYGRIETRKDLVTATPNGTRKNGFGYGESSPARLICHGDAEVVFLSDEATAPVSR